VSKSQPFRIVDGATSRGNHDRDAARRRLAEQRVPTGLRSFRAAASTFQLTPPLEVAINTALAVGAPLLVTGEPGTGKTQVAWYLGWYFDAPVFDFQVRSTSTADDLRFDFDAVGYLRAAQHPDPDDQRKKRSDFLTPKALWQAYECTTPCVLLIDEIDKAPRDFPNDLLLELDKHEFRHPFEDRTIRPRAERPPVVVITSNAERRLPDPFLRRCIFHHIVLDDALVERVVRARRADFPQLDDDTTRKAVGIFHDLRQRERVQKKPSTGELLAWLAVLSAKGLGAADLDVPLRDVPALGALIKDHRDLDVL
jgi:MoxR-like ATPase